MKTKPNGFTLVEIMIVVAIVGLLAGIAIPNLLRSRVNANEGATKGNLKTFSVASESFRTVQVTLAYPSDVAALVDATPSYLDASWNSNPKNGFTITYTAAASPAATYALLAEAVPNLGGTTDYCVDHTGVIVSGDAGTVLGPGTGCTGGTPLGS